MREFVKVAADYPQVISAVDRHAVFKARQFMLKEKSHSSGKRTDRRNQSYACTALGW